jgi:hypothetical protein
MNAALSGSSHTPEGVHTDGAAQSAGEAHFEVQKPS